MRQVITRFAAGALLAVSSVALAADTPEPSTQIRVADSLVSPCNTATVKALGFITVGKATLYRTDCAGAEPLAPPMALEFGYKREIPGSAMGKAASVMIERNVEQAVFNRLQERINQFNQAYRDIKPGDRYQLIYDTDGQVSLLYNGVAVAEEQGHEFALTYLQIWFGPDPYSDAMKDELLAGFQNRPNR